MLGSCLDSVVLGGFSSRNDSMIVGSGEEESPGWAPRAAGPEQGFVFTEGRHESHVQDLWGLEEFSLLGSALLVGTGVHPNSCCPPPLGLLSTFPFLTLGAQESLGSTKSSPRRST